MPLYSYKCPICGKEMEAHRLIDDRDFGPICPNASHDELRMDRLITFHKSYSIKGDNSASVTPKKFRGNS